MKPPGRVAGAAPFVVLDESRIATRTVRIVEGMEGDGRAMTARRCRPAVCRRSIRMIESPEITPIRGALEHLGWFADVVGRDMWRRGERMVASAGATLGVPSGLTLRLHRPATPTYRDDPQGWTIERVGVDDDSV